MTTPDQRGLTLRPRSRALLRAILIAGLFASVLSLRLPAAVVGYDIVYVRAPRGADGSAHWADVYAPMRLEPGSDLVLLHPDGTEEVLVPAGKGAVTDPCVSFDAQWVYYSYLPDPMPTSPINNVPLAGADIYKINLRSKQVVRLTNQEYTPNTSVRTSRLPYGVFNMGPCPVAGGKIVFTSNRNGFIPPKQYTPVTSQLFIMDEDGTNVRAIAPMTLGAALHPFQLKDGRIAFSTQEAQGLRDNRVWALWAIWPDGREWEPLMSAFSAGAVFHFSTQLTSGDLVMEDYYNLNNMGFGTFHRFPVPPAGAVRFHSATRSENPPLVFTDPNGNRGTVQYSFSPKGITTLTPFTTMKDEAAAVSRDPAQPRVGKVTHPAAAPGNDLLLVWSSGPVNILNRPVSVPLPDAGIYLARGAKPVQSPSELVLIKNDSRYNELWPRAVVPYREIYGVDHPFEFPFLPNDGTVNPALPAGTAFGIIGTSSFYKRESFPASAESGNYISTGIHNDGLEPFNGAGENLNSNWNIQGSDAGKFTNDQIAAVRIVMMEPQTEMAGEGGPKFFNHVNERLRILGEIPLRKSHADGRPVLDSEGNPDTSFWAVIPADTPISFQVLDGDGRLLTMAQTWHQVRPGEVRVDCGGCHAHSQTPLAFEGTAAAKLPPVDLTGQPARDVEFIRDIQPVLQRSCISCHKEPMQTAPAQLAFTADAATNYARLANDKGATAGIKPVEGALRFWNLPNVSRYGRVFQSRRSLLIWKLYEQRLDGWTNGDWPSSATGLDRAKTTLIDLDYERGAVDHRALLSDSERRLFSSWIDLAMPIDQGGGYWRDENRPTLTLKIAGNELLVGAADAYSGIDAASLSVSVNSKKVSLKSKAPGIWSAQLVAPSTVVTARVKDRAGNWTEMTLRPRGDRPEDSRSHTQAR